MMGDGLTSDDMMKGCDMMGGGVEHMQHMMLMMHEKLSHSGDRIASLKTELKITESQMPAWTKFSDALLASAKTMEESMDAMHKYMQSGVMLTLPEKLDHHAQMAAAHIRICRRSRPRLIRFMDCLATNRKNSGRPEDRPHGSDVTNVRAGVVAAI